MILSQVLMSARLKIAYSMTWARSSRTLKISYKLRLRKRLHASDVSVKNSLLIW